MSKNVKEFRFGWNAKDAHTNFMELTCEQIGVLMQIINLIYIKRGRIENDPKWIAQSIHDMGSAKCRRIIKELLEKDEIYLDDRGKIGQKRTENEVEIVKGLRKSTNFEQNPSENETDPERNSRENGAKLARNSAENKDSFEQNQQHNNSLEIEVEIEDRSSGIYSKVLEELPNLKPDVFRAFLEHRKSIGKPVHPNFVPSILSDLKKLNSDGEDPNLVIEQSIKNGWTSLQPTKKEKSNGKRKSRKQDLGEQARKLMDKYADPEPHPSDDSLL